MKKWVALYLLIIFIVISPFALEYLSQYVYSGIRFSPWAQFDMRRMCATSENLLKSEPDRVKRIYTLAVQVERGFYSPSAKNIMNAFGMSNPEQVPELFKLAMSEMGDEKYECPAILKMYAPEN